MSLQLHVANSPCCRPPRGIVSATTSGVPRTSRSAWAVMSQGVSNESAELRNRCPHVRQRCVDSLLLSSSMENKLLGEWRSAGPEGVRLSISRTSTSNGFHDGFHETRNGRTDTSDWRIDDQGEGPMLILQGRGVFNDLLRNTSQGVAAQSRHKIVALTSEKLIVEWKNVGSFFSGVADRQSS